MNPTKIVGTCGVFWVDQETLKGVIDSFHVYNLLTRNKKIQGS